MTRVLHVISGLGTGGAEANLVRLATALQARGAAQHVVSVSSQNDSNHGAALAASGIGLTMLDVNSPAQAVSGLLTLRRLARSLRPDILQGWMYYGDFFAALAHRLSPGRAGRRLFWNLRASNTHEGGYGSLVRVCAALSRWPDAIVANSRAGADYHVSRGYRPHRIEIIPNGIDTALFRPDDAARARIRRELEIDADAIVAIHVARVDPMKDQDSFIAAMRDLPHVVAIMAGKGTESLEAPANVRRLGLRKDMAALYAASDIVVSTSVFAEGFSNILAEGISAGLVPVATDIGDARAIVGDTGTVIVPRDRATLAAAIAAEAARPATERQARGLAARARIVEHFGLERAIARYMKLYGIDQ
jgi:glycosyltransferase involved in cell wall biosynthesis